MGTQGSQGLPIPHGKKRMGRGKVGVRGQYPETPKLFPYGKKRNDLIIARGRRGRHKYGVLWEEGYEHENEGEYTDTEGEELPEYTKADEGYQGRKKKVTDPIKIPPYP